MHPLEAAAIALRRSPLLRNAEPLWHTLRPMYARLLRRWRRNGLKRTINGTDPILIAPELYNLPEEYEPAVWRALMSEVRPGSVVADVGAYIGLYTVALAKRVGASGKVHAFEPDPATFRKLQHHIKINGVQSRVSLSRCAVGDKNESASFTSGRDSQSHLSLGHLPQEGQKQTTVQVVTLDAVLQGSPVDVMKVDVEGFEEHVLRGASQLLADERRAPRVIFIEVHPYAWGQSGTSSESLLKFLRDFGYEVFDFHGDRVEAVSQYGEVIARRTG